MSEGGFSEVKPHQDSTEAAALAPGQNAPLTHSMMAHRVAAGGVHPESSGIGSFSGGGVQDVSAGEAQAEGAMDLCMTPHGKGGVGSGRDTNTQHIPVLKLLCWLLSLLWLLLLLLPLLPWVSLWFCCGVFLRPLRICPFPANTFIKLL